MRRRATEVDDFLLYQIAKMYYVDNMTQEAISRTTSFSRSHISRLLDKARERGLVSFVVTNPLEHIIDELEDQLKERFGLKYVAVEGVTSDEYQGLSRRSLIDCLAQRAARCLPGYLAGSKIVAVGLGRTLYSVSKQLEHNDQLLDALILPAAGTTTATAPETQSNLIVDNFSSAFGAKRYFTNVPIVVDRDEMQSKLFQQRRRELAELWATVDTAVIGLGGPYRSSTDPFNFNQASEVYRELVAASDIKGDILGTFFFEDGSELELDENYVRNCMGLRDLGRVDRVLCIAGGPLKVRGMLTALRMGFINGLITDSVTASEIIEISA